MTSFWWVISGPTLYVFKNFSRQSANMSSLPSKKLTPVKTMNWVTGAKYVTVTDIKTVHHLCRRHWSPKVKQKFGPKAVCVKSYRPIFPGNDALKLATRSNWSYLESSAPRSPRFSCASSPFHLSARSCTDARSPHRRTSTRTESRCLSTAITLLVWKKTFSCSTKRKLVVGLLRNRILWKWRRWTRNKAVTWHWQTVVAKLRKYFALQVKYSIILYYF